MSDLELIEQYPRDYKLTQFEKILVAAKRAKDLHNGKVPLVPSERRFTYVALQEFNSDAIEMVQREEIPPAKIVGDDPDDEE